MAQRGWRLLQDDDALQHAAQGLLHLLSYRIEVIVRDEQPTQRRLYAIEGCSGGLSQRIEGLGRRSHVRVNRIAKVFKPFRIVGARLRDRLALGDRRLHRLLQLHKRKLRLRHAG